MLLKEIHKSLSEKFCFYFKQDDRIGKLQPLKVSGMFNLPVNLKKNVIADENSYTAYINVSSKKTQLVKKFVNFKL